MLSKYRTSLLSFLLVLFTFDSYAGVIIGGTRIIYQGDKKESSISIRNPDSKPYLIQSWIEPEGKNAQQTSTIPFIVTPPLFRLNADASNALRIVKSGNTPEDKESVYWLNIKAIPTSDPNVKNELHISVNSRIKIFYRPGGLSDQDAAVAYKAITFKRAGDKLVAKNPTPYFISIGELKVNGIEIATPGMIAPMSEASWALPSKSSALNVTWSAINDYGGRTPAETKVL
ncbi:molecular chaperone [Serratia fonticola]|uniref:fimbrial biogenesis chaperone n=1 Tax=Serratia fonticola TaxID=47917 RepID=UPI003BB5BA5F